MFRNAAPYFSETAFRAPSSRAKNISTILLSSNPGFSFKHVCSYVLTEVTDANIHKMTLTASGQNLSGTLPVTLSESGELSFGAIRDATSSVSARFEATGQPILAILPGVSFADGATLEFFNADGDPVSSHTLKKDFILHNGGLLNLGKLE